MTLHTIAAGGGTNFVFNDPAMEPLLEIYQGCRLSYEAAAAPRRIALSTEPVDSARATSARGMWIVARTQEIKSLVSIIVHE